MQKEIIDYTPGRVIPYFALSIKLKDGTTPRPLRMHIHFDGLEKPDFINIARDPESPGQ